MARTIDSNRKHLTSVLRAASEHQGTAFVEIFQNCIVYNDDVFASFTDKKQGADQKQLWVEHGQPLVFAGGTKGLAIDTSTLTLKVVDVIDGDTSGIVVHDRTNRALAHMLVEMPFGLFPMALGVLLDDPAPTFDSAVVEQNRAAAAGRKPDLQKLLGQGQTWMVDKQPHVI